MRKFDPLRNGMMLNMVDQSIFGLYTSSKYYYAFEIQLKYSFTFISIIQDVKSLNSYWYNIYFQAENNLEPKYKVLFFYFKQVLEENVNKRINMLQNQKKDHQFEFFYEDLKKNKIINKVDSFFEGGKFKG
jgi:hypothetical protein